MDEERGAATSGTGDEAYEPCRTECLYPAAETLERYLGDPGDPNAVVSFRNAVELDERDEYPEAAYEALNAWGYQLFYVPVRYGGRLDAFDECLAMLRVVGRRDPTLSLSHGQTFLGAMAVWVGGDEAQRWVLADWIRNGVQVPLALTERLHGSDLLATECQASRVAGGYIITGEKWLINLGTRSRAMVVLSRTRDPQGPASLTLLLVDKESLSPATYRHLSRVRTLGMRGADVSGIHFTRAFVRGDAVVGREGAGLPVTLKALQVSRVLTVSLSLGAADTALRTTLAFALQRRLYGETVFTIPYARRQLVEAFVDLLVCDCVTIAAARGLSVLTEQFNVWSAVVKFLVPVAIEDLVRQLAVVLGARFYLREGHEAGIFQKLMRDSAVVSVFDGSTAVNLHAIARQLRGLFARWRSRELSESEEDTLRLVFSFDRRLAYFEPERLAVMNPGGRDDVIQGLSGAVERMREARLAGGGQEPLTLAHALAEDVLGEMEPLAERFAALARRSGMIAAASPEAFEIAKRYCVLHAAATCLHTWLHSGARLSEFVASATWLVLALARLLSRLGVRKRDVPDPYWERAATELCRLHEDRRMFSLLPITLAC